MIVPIFFPFFSDPRLAKGQAIGFCAGFGFIFIMFASGLLVALLPAGWGYAYLTWLNQMLGTVDSSFLENYFGDGLFGRAITVALAHGCTLLMIVLSFIPFIALTAPRWWKLPLFIGLSWFFGGWFAAIFLPIRYIHSYLSFLGRHLGVVDDWTFSNIWGAGVGEAGMYILFAHFLTVIVVGIFGGIVIGILAGIYYARRYIKRRSVAKPKEYYRRW